MLQIGKIRSARARYYLSTTLAGGGDENGLIEPDGRFVGTLGDELHVGGTVVDPDGLRALFAGIDPKTGTVLDRRHERVAIAAYDCMFASPKSVSLLHALAADDVVQAVRTAHEHAVGGALGYLEKNASYVRRQGSLAKSDGFVAAQFVHRTSRASDPHLHSHVLVANLAVGKDGRWSAIDARPMFANVGVAGSLYRAQLRNEITTSLGIEWKLRVQGFSDLIGISPRALRAFSKRSAEIKDELDRSGRLGERAGRVAADRTRPAKETS
ncbi:MAG TPA: MobF family relaxase, partial [Acidimicrobiales bacterium]|nr:MobF family relaxase [Acidimicrobiales bacterium]